MDHCTRSIRARIVYRMPLYSTAWSSDTNQKLSKALTTNAFALAQTH